MKITQYLLQLMIYYYIALRWLSMWITELNVLFIWKQNDMEELDDILTSVFKQEIPYYKFQSLQTEICPQKECEYFTTASVILSYFSVCQLAVNFIAKNIVELLIRYFRKFPLWESKLLSHNYYKLLKVNLVIFFFITGPKMCIKKHSKFTS